MKKLLSIITFLLCAISISADEFYADGIRYFLNNGIVKVGRQPTMLSGNITIPEKVSYEGVSYMVSGMCDAAFANSGITSIKLPNSITSIGNNCFYWCKCLQSVTLSDSIKSLGEECFAICEKLTNIVLPNNITSLGKSCFYCCTSLTSVKLPNNITSLGEKCFYGCVKMPSISLPYSITSLGDNCFGECWSLTSIIIPSSITSLSKNCFSDCKSLTSITLPNSITSLGDWCFVDCHNLTSITLPNSITSLGNYCFDYCTRLTNITFPNSITSLGKQCYDNCPNLTKVICPWNNVDIVSVDSTAFDNIFSEAKLYVPKGTIAIYKAKYPWSNFKNIIEIGTQEQTDKMVTIDGILYYLDKVQAIVMVQPSALSGDITIPEKVTYDNVTYTVSNIVFCAFSEIQIKSISLPNSISSIEDNCFRECTGLTSITFPNSLTSLGTYCFFDCTSLTNVTLPYSITSIGEECFRNCTNLMKVTCQWKSLDDIPISINTFYNIPSEATLYVPKGTTDLYKTKEPWKRFKYIVEDDPSDINLVKQRGIMVQSNDGFLTVSGLNANEQVSLYNVSGMELGKTNAVQGTATFSVNNPGEIVILKVGNESIKFQLK